MQSLLDCLLYFYLNWSRHCPEKSTERACSLATMCPRFPGQSEHQMCFQFFPSTTKMLFIFQHFCVQMHLPIWFSHIRIITKHLPIMLSVIIFKILQHSSCDKCLLVGSDPQPRMVTPAENISQVYRHLKASTQATLQQWGVWIFL